MGLRAALASALAASIATFLQLLVVIGYVYADVLRRLWLPVVAAALVLVGVAVVVYRARRGTAEEPAAEGARPPRRPAPSRCGRR